MNPLKIFSIANLYVEKAFSFLTPAFNKLFRIIMLIGSLSRKSPVGFFIAYNAIAVGGIILTAGYMTKAYSQYRFGTFEGIRENYLSIPLAAGDLMWNCFVEIAHGNLNIFIVMYFLGLFGVVVWLFQMVMQLAGAFTSASMGKSSQGAMASGANAWK